MSVATEIPQLYCVNRPLDMSPEHFGLMTDSTGLLDDADGLRQRIDADGYLYLPRFHDRDQVLPVRREMMRRLADAGNLHPDRDPMDGIPRPELKMQFHPDLAKDNAPAHELLYTGRMMEFFRRFFGEDALHFDFTWVRAVAPGPATPIHSDIVYMGRGTHQLYTVWTPIGDATFDMGGLMVLEGSHRHEGLARGYWKMDVDSYCENRPGQKDAWAKGSGGFLRGSPDRIRQQVGGRWLTQDYRMGDVVVFHTYLVHGGTDNRSGRMRLSTDTRYQPASQPADERWIGENPVGHGKAGKRGRVC